MSGTKRTISVKTCLGCTFRDNAFCLIALSLNLPARVLGGMGESNGISPPELCPLRDGEVKIVLDNLVS